MLEFANSLDLQVPGIYKYLELASGWNFTGCKMLSCSKWSKTSWPKSPSKIIPIRARYRPGRRLRICAHRGSPRPNAVHRFQATGWKRFEAAIAENQNATEDCPPVAFYA
jgi:hypothetical protein